MEGSAAEAAGYNILYFWPGGMRVSDILKINLIPPAQIQIQIIGSF